LEANEKTKVGSIGWVDLTVGDAESVREFYKKVIGWQHEEVDMGGYSDFSMTLPSTGEGVAGVCHARGSNADTPAQWLIYVNVDNLDRSIAAVKELGGAVVVGPKSMGSARYAVIRDPAGAVCALFQP
jgi:predicted enzyme related to lactoylglutathione lyase